MSTRDSRNLKGNVMTTADRDRVEDLLSGLALLDEACGLGPSADLHFRFRVRQLMMNTQLLLTRPERVLPEVGRD
jgi:hypothetical protein